MFQSGKKLTRKANASADAREGEPESPRRRSSARAASPPGRTGAPRRPSRSRARRRGRAAARSRAATRDRARGAASIGFVTLGLARRPPALPRALSPQVRRRAAAADGRRSGSGCSAGVDGVVERAGQVGPEVVERRRARLDPARRAGRVARAERMRAGERLPEHHPDRPDVGGGASRSCRRSRSGET